mmetsp:Transcript_23059/g.50737  ORF Transcript_23059/g.50737 Transcript_23059/m.50737 type:complete len:201 (-) Transcript_23059:286-888(-)
MPHTKKQMTKITFARVSPNSSSFCCRGVLASSSEASDTAWLIPPITVRMPVLVTTPTHCPVVTCVCENSILCLSGMEAFFIVTTSGILPTLSASPVIAASSTRKVVVVTLITRTSAGTASPTLTSTMSPGTTSAASISFQSPLRSTMAFLDCIFFKASSAASALDSCQTPTIAFAVRIRRITSGSTYASQPSSLCSSCSK